MAIQKAALSRSIAAGEAELPLPARKDSARAEDKTSPTEKSARPPHVGHLAIFVSAAVARLKHRAILEHLADIDALEPGLYEMKIDNPTRDPDCARHQYSMRFEPRRIEDLNFDYPRAAFERVRQVSEWNESVFRTFASPWVAAMRHTLACDIDAIASSHAQEPLRVVGALHALDERSCHTPMQFPRTAMPWLL